MITIPTIRPSKVKGRKLPKRVSVASVFRAFLLLGMMAFSVPGCKEEPVTQYGNSLVNALDKSERTANQANLAAFQRAIDTYRASNGNYPASLEEIETFTGERLDPLQYDYSPETGKLRIRP